jgi:histidyl-tRNA synthetase
VAKKKITSLKGFRDLLPEDMAYQNWFIDKAKEVSRLFGYQQYDGPMLEPFELYAAKSGDELVNKQSFVFRDRGDRKVVLRPEMTPTLARIIAEKEGEIVLPAKWFTIGSRFRYEKPQKGRGREFIQWDIDLIGSTGSLADAEIIAVAACFYRLVDLSPDDVIIKINDRKLLRGSLLKAGTKKDQLKNVLTAIDKRDKVSSQVFNNNLANLGVSTKTIRKITKIIEDKELYKESENLTEIFKYLEKFGVSDYIKFDASVVRGLDYYTSTVFEGWDVNGNFRALWGGGRYDNLTSDVGSKKKIPGVGFAMGDMVLYELLKENKKLPSLKPTKTKALVTIFSEKQLDSSFKLVNMLRNANIPTEIYPDPKENLKKQLKYADKKNIPYAVIVGPDEIVKDEAVLKDLKAKKQETIPQQSLLARIK